MADWAAYLGLRRGERPPIGDHSPVGYSQTH